MKRRLSQRRSRTGKAAGARRALPLAVSGAFHTPLMAKAAAELRAYVADFTFSAPKMDIYSNLDGKVYDCSDLPAHLEQHMISRFAGRSW